jgi:hypothetical protein
MVKMKNRVLLVVFALVAAMPFCAARGARIAALPSPGPGAFADAESSTNIVLAVDRAKLFSLGFTIELSPSTTNCLEIALGADADGDGGLSPEESDVLFGYDCGEWFMRNGDGAEVTDAASGGRPRREAFFPKRVLRPEWSHVRITRRGSGDLAQTVSTSEQGVFFGIVIR